MNWSVRLPRGTFDTYVRSDSLFSARVDHQDGHQRVEEELGCVLSSENEVSMHLVRSVAPNKEMYCISFRLPRATAFGEVAHYE